MNAPSLPILMMLYTTMPSLKEAEYLAKQAVEAKLAISINIIPGTQSISLYDKEVKSSVECCMVFKTTKGYLPLLEQWIIARHPYAVPDILKWEVIASQPYFEHVLHHLTE